MTAASVLRTQHLSGLRVIPPLAVHNVCSVINQFPGGTQNAWSSPQQKNLCSSVSHRQNWPITFAREREGALLGCFFATLREEVPLLFSRGDQAPAKGKRDRQLWKNRSKRTAVIGRSLEVFFVRQLLSVESLLPACGLLAGETQEAEATPNPGPPAVSGASRSS
jgi:hypothetical protein